MAKHRGRDYVLLRKKVGQVPPGAMTVFSVVGMFTIPLAVIGLIGAAKGRK